MWTVIFVIWATWFLFNLYIVLFTRRYGIVGDGAYVTGIFWNQSIILSPRLTTILEQDEFRAIVEHEKGHIAHGHLLENFCVAVFLPLMLFFRQPRYIEQEWEADDYAADSVGAGALASAILKLSGHPFDISRAERLLRHVQAHRYSENGCPYKVR